MSECELVSAGRVCAHTLEGTGSTLQSNANMHPHPQPLPSICSPPSPAWECTAAQLASTLLFANGGERLLPCQSAWPLIRPSGYPQILFPDGGEIGPQRPGPPQTPWAWRPPLIFYLMEVL